MKNVKNAFTLAEVLVTIAIIGVVSALTIPTVVNNYQKHVVETKLKAFYSTINQALLLYKAKNGFTMETLPNCQVCTYQVNLDWLKKYILPYIRYNKVKQCKIATSNLNGVCVYMSNGDSFSWSIDGNGGDVAYCIKCDADLEVTSSDSKKRFLFQFNKKQKSNGTQINSKNFIEPYTYDWDGTVEGLKNHSRYGCKLGTSYNYCAKYIQLNNWKIPDDYPW